MGFGKQAYSKKQYKGGSLCEVSRKVKMSQKEASRKAHSISKADSKEITSYQCRHCDRWHLSHSRGKNFEAMTVPGLGRIAIRRYDR